VWRPEKLLTRENIFNRTKTTRVAANKRLQPPRNKNSHNQTAGHNHHLNRSSKTTIGANQPIINNLTKILFK
jgi:hypothetical protein